MHDQADELRNLMLKVARQHAAQYGPPPRLVLLCGGKGGVGVTSLAVNLAVALAHQAARIVLVDADLYRADAAALCGIDDTTSIADLLEGSRDIHEVLRRGPAGMQIVPGAWAPDEPRQFSEGAQRRLVAQLGMLGRHAEAVLLDAGSGLRESLRWFWRSAGDVLLVTTPDSVAVMDTYASIKTLLPQHDRPKLWLIVNRAESAGQAVDVHHRIDRSCRRFLDVPLTLLGHVEPDDAFEQAAGASLPLVIHAPHSAAAAALERLAADLMAALGERVRVATAA